jgi:hypothetical protein
LVGAVFVDDGAEPLIAVKRGSGPEVATVSEAELGTDLMLWVSKRRFL